MKNAKIKRYKGPFIYRFARTVLIVSVFVSALFIINGVMAFPASGLLVLAMIATGVGKQTCRRLTTLGSARWAEAADMRRAGMLNARRGLIIGRLPPRRRFRFIQAIPSLFRGAFDAKTVCRDFIKSAFRGNQDTISLPNAVHSAIFAPTGAGKSQSLVVPFLKTCDESCVVLDYKGELAELTAEHRRKHFGHQIVVLTTRNAQTSDTLNPLDAIDKAQSLETSIKGMTESTAWNGLLARAGGQLQHFVEREKSSTLTTVARHLRFLDSPAVVRSTTKSTFDPTQLRRGKMTIYLTVPPDQAALQTPVLRMWVTALMRVAVGGGIQEQNRLHFVLDEAATLGHLEPIATALDQYRGYGIRLQLYYQSMGQLKKCWPNGQEQTVLSNCSQIFFGVNDQAVGAGGTADYVSARLGDQTIVVTSGGRTTGTSTSYTGGGREGSHSNSYSDSKTDNWQQQARRLLKPEEICTLPARTAIPFIPEVPPVITQLLRAYEEPKLGVRPGRLGRWFGTVGTLAGCVLIAAMFVFVSFGFMGLAQSVHAPQRNRILPQPVKHEQVRSDLPIGEPRQFSGDFYVRHNQADVRDSEGRR